jgi:hypothetical protein
VTKWRAVVLAGGLAWWGAVGVRQASGQAIPAPPARYLLTTEAADARALWVNPAGLARLLEASIGADMTWDRYFPGGAQLSEYGLSLAGRGVAASWIHERFPPRRALNAYAVGVGLGDERFSAGTTRRWYSGAVSGSAWDAAARVAYADGTQLSLVMKNVGSPRLLDSTYWATLVPGALVSLLGGSLQLGGEWEVAPHAWRSIAYRAGATVLLARGFALLVRADLSPGFKRRALVVAFNFDASRSRAGAFALLSGGANEVDALGLSGAVVTRGAPPRR